MQEHSDARLCEFCGYTLTPACGSSAEARGCHFYRKVHLGEGETEGDASGVKEAPARDLYGTFKAMEKPYSVDVNHTAEAARAEADWAIDRRTPAYTGEQHHPGCPSINCDGGAPCECAKLHAYQESAATVGDAVTLPPHYTRWKIEPIYFIEENEMPFWMGNIIKYVTRADAKNGIEDLRKARRYIEMKIKQLEGDPEWSSK
jgi:hypothetical protein